jgi:hypothetical protein
MATKTASKLKTFSITGRISVDVGVEIGAEDWDAALVEAKKLKVEDFISILGDYQDGRDVEITTIWKNE